VLIEHPAVAEAAVVPSPDALRLSVPKAFVVLTAAYQPSDELAGEIFAFCREHLPAFKRIRRLEFAELPKTISGKIRRVELRANEEARHGTDSVPGAPVPSGLGREYSDSEFQER
jgi:acetyl-CoA synthetase